MYLVPYILIAIMYGGALVIGLRSRAAYDRSTPMGITARVVVSALLVALVCVIFKYVTVETFEATKWDDDKLVFWVRFISTLLCAGGIFEVWTDAKTGEL